MQGGVKTIIITIHKVNNITVGFWVTPSAALDAAIIAKGPGIYNIYIIYIYYFNLYYLKKYKLK